MKIRKIFYIVATTLFSLIITSCYIAEKPNKQPLQTTQPAPTYTIKEEPKEVKKIKKLKVAVMLPLTGKDAEMGQSMLNSINISLFDNDVDGKIELIIFDNKSSDSASKKAIQDIANQNIKLVIGPIFTNSVESISQIAAQNNITIISFSNNSNLINQKGIFLAGFSLEQEIDRITSYLINNGKMNFSVITQNDQYGIRVAETLRKMVEAKDGNFISSQFYMNSQGDFAKIAQKTVSSYIIAKNNGDHKAELNAISNVEARNARELEIISKYKIYTDIILITESSSKTPAIIKAIKDANRDGRNIQIIGTSHWHKDSIINNEIMDGALFTESGNDFYDKFVEKYSKIYHKNPSKIDSIAYDMAAFVIDLSDEIQSEKSINSAIVNFNNKKGYKGVNGLFRFLPNGLIERNLAVMQIKNKGLNQTGKAPNSFIKY